MCQVTEYAMQVYVNIKLLSVNNNSIDLGNDSQAKVLTTIISIKGLKGNVTAFCNAPNLQNAGLLV